MTLATALATAAREADALLASNDNRQAPRPEPKRRDWSQHDSQIPFREPGGVIGWRVTGHRSGYATEGGVTMGRITWADFYKMRPDRRPA